MNTGKDILILLPSKGRPGNVKRFYKSWEGSKNSDVLLILDDDEVEYSDISEFITERVKNKRMVEKINYGAKKYVDNYSVIGFVGDDVVIETKNWEKKILDRLKKYGTYSIVFPNDGYKKNNLPSHIFMTKALYKKLGWFAYPKMTHLYIDAIWRHIGNYINIKKLDGGYGLVNDVVMRHLHWSLDKSVKKDYTYINAYKQKPGECDKTEFIKFKETWRF